jgi:predicted NBD/HSP70 family sugar kinase/mannose-6-phosphate isomerase class I
MKLSKKIIGLDVGGSHVTAGWIDTGNAMKGPFSLIWKDFNAHDIAFNIVTIIGDCIRELLTIESGIDAIGIAFPGPCDYDKGVVAVANVGGKFEQIFGLHIKQAIIDFSGSGKLPVKFTNDAHCFALGAYHKYQLKSKRTVCLTLGTGFGSGFMLDGVLMNLHPDLPAGGMFFNQPFQESLADDYFSTRWLLNAYKIKTGTTICSVKKMVESQPAIASLLFAQLGTNLGTFLLPWLAKFKCDELVIGGNIARSAALFLAPLEEQLAKLNSKVNIVFCPDTEACILTGAAIIAGNQIPETPIIPANSRMTTQPLLPVSISNIQADSYGVFPSFHTNHIVQQGFDTLADKIGQEKTVVIDGFGGVMWEQFRTHLHHALLKKNKKVFWYDINACLHSPEDINALLAESLNGDDPVFGKKYMGSLADFFDAGLLQLMQPDFEVDCCIVYGTGAGLSKWDGLLIYVDVPKNEIQYRMRTGCATNIGSNLRLANNQTYKRFYFADWPVLNKHKQQLLPQIDFIIDEQRINEITWMQGDDFRNSLNEMLEQPFRARPWFEAGIWGGNWMKDRINGLNKTEVNYAWSFELITPENGIVFEADGRLMEVSFDFLLFQNNEQLLGKAAKRFGTEFPIRFDFLDTFDGGNLSVQCHPRPQYIKDYFGENFTQDETYYILDCKLGANVYLGFQDNINPSEFKAALMDAQENGTELPVENYIQKLPAQKHDLFLIPGGTIHASGKNNMVLEISNTPYIFTFKMYDWQRLDLNGQPRPINIEHAFNNLCFDRKGADVHHYLVSKPQLIKEWPLGRLLKLPTHEEHFYTIDRYEFTGSVTIHTNGQCHIGMLVEGDQLEVITGDHHSRFCYAETFVIPAAVKSYELTVRGTSRAFVVVAYVKDVCCQYKTSTDFTKNCF